MSYHFKSDVELEPGQVLLVVNYDPSKEPMITGALQQSWGLPLMVSVYGPFKGRLDNGGDLVRLQELVMLPNSMGLEHNAESLGWVDEDRIEYASDVSWVTPLQSGVFSLHRLDQDSYGNVSLNWGFNSPSPGQLSEVTHPKQNSGFIQGLSLVEGGIVLEIATQVGVRYTVQHTDALNRGHWNDLRTLTGTGDSDVVFDASPYQDTRFYRVIAEQSISPD